MNYYVWRTWLWVNIALTAGGFVSGVMCAITQGPGMASEKWGGLIGVCGITAVVSWLSFGMYTDLGNPESRPERHPSLPREQRKQLRKAQARIDLEAAIQDAERRAGIYR